MSQPNAQRVAATGASAVYPANYPYPTPHLTAGERMAATIETILEQDKLFVLGAKLLKKTVEALMAQGFTREEAVKIVAVQGSIVKEN